MTENPLICAAKLFKELYITAPAGYVSVWAATVPVNAIKIRINENYSMDTSGFPKNFHGYPVLVEKGSQITAA